MAFLKETTTWEDGIYQFEQSDWLSGGEDGLDNVPLRQLANRTSFLKKDAKQMRDDMNEFTKELRASFDALKAEADKKIQEAIEYSKGILPIGTIISYPKFKGQAFGQWHLCDGSEFDTKTYHELFYLLKTDRLPNLTDKRLFIRSCNADGDDVGVVEGDAIRNITGYFQGKGLFYNNDYGTAYANTGGAFTSYGTSSLPHNDEGYGKDRGIKFDASR